jgi:hypothetical protein
VFLENKYSKYYFSIIDNAKNRINTNYVEKHHILPKCMGGTDVSDNIVELTGREHFLCHVLLIKMLPSGKIRRDLSYALVRFMSKCKNHLGRKILNSREYELVRKIVSREREGIKPSAKCFEALSKKLKGIPLTTEHKLKLSNSSKKIIKCQVITPEDKIVDVDDLKEFCKKHKLSANYFYGLYSRQDDRRIENGNSKNWGIYLGIIRPKHNSKNTNRQNAVMDIWGKELLGKTNRNTKYKWVFRDPNNNIVETLSINELLKQHNRGSTPLHKSDIGVPIPYGFWKDWVVLEKTLLKEIK